MLEAEMKSDLRRFDNTGHFIIARKLAENISKTLVGVNQKEKSKAIKKFKNQRGTEFLHYILE